MLAPTNAPMGQLQLPQQRKTGGFADINGPNGVLEGFGADMLGNLLNSLVPEKMAMMGPPPPVMPQAPQQQGPGMAMVAPQYQQLMARRPPPMGMQQTQGEARTSVGAALGGY